MNEREQRGIVIAARCKITRKSYGWIVSSQSGPEKYTVHADQEKPTCTCKDFELRGMPCKHIFAVEIGSCPTCVEPLESRATRSETKDDRLTLQR